MSGDAKVDFNFFDVETSGTSSSDQIIQFGAIGTDENMSIINKTNIFCKLKDDVIPHPMATLTHKISIKDLREKGLDDIEFARAIESVMTQDVSLCNLGYNTLKFDDQKIRELFYKNMMDPYAREWKNFNSRSDIFSLVRMINVLKPKSINWMTNDDGKVSLRLEHMAKANGIEQLNAHDALSDVEATIGVASLIKKNTPQIYAHFMTLRRKEAVASHCKNPLEPFLYIGKGAEFEHKYATVLLPITNNADNKNSVICFDLRYEHDSLYGDKDLIRQRMFARRDNPELERFPMMEVAINQSPVVCGLGKVTDEVLASVGLDRNLILEKVEAIRDPNSPEILQKMCEYGVMAFQGNGVLGADSPNVYDKIYTRFYSNYERGVLNEFTPDNVADWVRKAALVGAEDILELTIRCVGNFNPDMLPESLPVRGGVMNAKEVYNNWLITRWSDQTGQYGLTVDQFREALKQVREEKVLTSLEENLLAELDEHVTTMDRRYGKDRHLYAEVSIKEPSPSPLAAKVKDPEPTPEPRQTKPFIFNTDPDF